MPKLPSSPEFQRPRQHYFLDIQTSNACDLVMAIAGFCFVLCLRYPSLLTAPPLRPYYQTVAFRLGLHFLLVSAFTLAALSLALRPSKILGSSAICITLLATILGGSRAQAQGELTSGAFLGLDWFVLAMDQQ